MRGGVSYIVKMPSKANNKCMKCYDSGKVHALLILMHIIYMIEQ